MERVNLLPDEVRFGLFERLLGWVDRYFLQALAGTAGILILVGMAISVRQGMVLRRREARLGDMKKEVQLLEVEVKNQSSYIKQLDQMELELQRQQKSIDLKLDYLVRAKEQPRTWAALLKELRRSIPNGVWLTELETGQENSLRITGGSSDANLVSQFMASLKGSPHFKYVGFTYTQKDTIGTVPVVKFEIVCRVS
ncbi:MAG: PilN domain-containing protein [Candidatus Omnitrophica bacterium]|nr:PilN domain-containing protein [Candidatus Omnitrophota bacterium]